MRQIILYYIFFLILINILYARIKHVYYEKLFVIQTKSAIFASYMKKMKYEFRYNYDYPGNFLLASTFLRFIF